MYEVLENRTPQRFTKATGVAFSFVLLLFTIFSGFAYATYGPSVQSNILQDLPQNGWGSTARMSMLVAVCGVYPFMVKPMVAPLRGGNMCFMKSEQVEDLVTLLIVLSAMTFAFYIANLGVVNAIAGALQVFSFVGLAPAAIGMYLLPEKERPASFLLYALCVFSVGASVLGFFYTN